MVITTRYLMLGASIVVQFFYCTLQSFSTNSEIDIDLAAVVGIGTVQQ